ncbi:hypothetical protein ACVUSC_18010, partial [Escherichia coli]
VTLKMPAFEWVHVQLHQQKGMISLSPPTICNSAFIFILVIGASSELRHCCNGGFYCFHDSNRTYTVMTLLAPMCNK